MQRAYSGGARWFGAVSVTRWACISLTLTFDHAAGVHAAHVPGQHVPGAAVGGVRGGHGGDNALVRDDLRLGLAGACSQAPGCLL